MTKQVLFIHGAGEDGYIEDRKLADSLQAALGPDYDVIYPHMPKADSPEYSLWKDEISRQLDQLGSGVILAGHSLGASSLLKYLSEEPIESVPGLFLASTPFWNAADSDVAEYAVADDFAARLPASVPIYFYHNRDDEFAPFSHLAKYAEKLPSATVREFDSGGHQFNNDMSAMAADIRSL
jgi:predicted alpha/beta hydrolase family esterase